MTTLVNLFALGLVLPALCTRLTFIAPTRLGAINYYSNVFGEFFVQRLGLSRGAIEAGLLVGGVLILLLAGSISLSQGMLILGIVAGLELHLRSQERRILDDVYAHLDARPPRQRLLHVGMLDYIYASLGVRPSSNGSAESAAGAVGRHPGPSVHPDLVVNLNGPFVRRLPYYDLGDLVVGRVIDVEIVIGNHSIVPSQVSTGIKVRTSGRLDAEPRFCCEVPPQASGDVFRGVIRLTAKQAGGPGCVEVAVTCGDRTTVSAIRYRSIFEAGAARPVKAEITRYPGASRSAFAWRGDMDQYDTSSFQSIGGLRRTLDLAARYRFPQTMYISSRLSLVPEEAREFYDHFRVFRGEDQIPEFISWLRDRVEVRHQISYPFHFDKPYALELGNHGHLHYGTDAAAARGNSWKLKARMEDGNYDWLGADRSSFSEQRDNALTTRRLCEELFDFTPKSWGVPDSTVDRYTPAAMEAAGCHVVVDSNASHKHSVLLQPPPHHPEGTNVVEITKRYPGDPRNIFHVAMLRYWIHRAHRRGIPVIFMCHQHMLQFIGHSCTRFTEYVLRYVLSKFNGDLHVNTVYGVGIYWNEVFSPKNRSVSVLREDDAVTVRNAGEIDLSAVPVDICYEGGRRATILVDLPPKSAYRILADGGVEAL